MTTTTTIPFNKLVATDDINARALAKDGLDELAASIEAKGLIQPLCVRPSSANPDRYEVIDGRRRHAAIQRLVKAKKWAKATPIAVLVRNEDDADALETSLVANTQRLPMHPVDQYEVFARLAAQGKTEADIAARFGLAERTVKQQLALGRLAPVIREAWRKGKIDAKVAQAFTMHPSHDVQSAAWDKLKGRAKGDTRFGGGLSDYDVRRELAGDRPAKSSVHREVLERYLAAGGTISEDLFEDKAYLDDGALARKIEDDMVAAWHAAKIAELQAQGWAWVALSPSLPPEWRWQWERVATGWDDVTEEEQARIDALQKQAQTAADAGLDAEAARLEAECDAIADNSELASYTPEMRAQSGAVIEIDYYDRSRVTIVFGVVKPTSGENGERRPAPRSGVAASTETEPCPDCGGVEPDDCDLCGGAGVVASEPDEDDGDEIPSVGAMVGGGEDEDAPQISSALLQTITTAQTQAAATAMTSDPALALRVLVATLRSSTWSSPAKISITPFTADLRKPGNRPDGEFEDEMQRLASEDVPALLDRLAVHVAASLSLLRSNASSPRDATDALVSALPSVPYLAAMRETFLADDYFKRATKATTLAAIEEMREAGCGAGLAPEDVLADMKKADLAAAASEAARACGWLPPELRHPEYALPAASAPISGATAHTSNEAA